jgi:hypothetical protein
MAVVAPTLDIDARTLLIEMLRQASRLEHCLLNAYLFAASSVKSMPWEFDSTGGAQPNRRRGMQFEKARLWKQNILNVSHEEMLHLHYVQCLLRALGEAPDFSLPERDATGAWVVPDWRPQSGTTASDGARVPVDKLDLQNAKRFVLYESTDSIQDEDPFGADSLALYAQLADFELDLFLEGVVYSIPDEATRAKITAQLKTIYTSLTPYEGKAAEAHAMLAATLPPGYEIRFQSIADLYNRGILPLYQQAFDFGWVKYSNLNLDNEQLNPNYAAQGFLPVGPVFRSPRFSRFAKKNVSDPLRHYKTVDDIVGEIVEEGEGFSLFRRRAEAMLAHVAANGGPRQFLTNLTKRSGWPEWMNEAQMVRMSHLYRFCLTFTDIQLETDLAHKSGGSFEPSRTPRAAGNDAGLRKLAAELPSVFNVCNLAMTAWLARMYEIREWLADTTRRQSIEMVATWPLMSLAIRPSLELCSFFEVDRAQLFRTDSAALPSLPVTARQLAQIYNAPERSEAINERMDYLAMRALAEVADWAREQCDAVENSALPAGPKRMILNRLHALAKLDEFEKQFPFRVAGGYSSTLPDITYQNAHPGATDYSEDPSSMVPNAPNPVPVFEDSLILRLRFAGWGQVQLSTDPDPPSDESGCTGTIMLHPADGPGARMDRALLWQDYSPNTILRTPAVDLPPLGVNCIGASLLVTDGAATAGYAPLFAMNSTGAVQASGVQQDLSISGLTEICSADAARLNFYLETKQGVPPHLEGPQPPRLAGWGAARPVHPQHLLNRHRRQTRRRAPS